MACKICPTTIAMGLLAAGGIGFAGYSMLGGECGAKLDTNTAVTTSVSDSSDGCSGTKSCDSGVTLASTETKDDCPLGGSTCDMGTEQLAAAGGQDSLTLVKAEAAGDACEGKKADCADKADCDPSDCQPADCATKCDGDAVASNGG